MKTRHAPFKALVQQVWNPVPEGKGVLVQGPSDTAQVSTHSSHLDVLYLLLCIYKIF